MAGGGGRGWRRGRTGSTGGTGSGRRRGGAGDGGVAMGGSRAGAGPAAMVACGGMGASAGKVARRVGGRVCVLCVLCMGRQRWRDSAKCGGTELCRVPTIWHTANTVV